MKAIILAAGDATRFKPALSKPKCLLHLGGSTLLERQLRLLDVAGVEQIAVVVGHLAGQIEQEVAGMRHRPRIHLIYNPSYHLGSALSLLCARELLTSGPVVILDADVLFAREVLTRVWRAPASNCLPVDERFLDTGEEVKAVALTDHRLEALGKNASGVRGRLIGESVGIFKFDRHAANDLSRCLELAVSSDPGIEYEPAIDSLSREVDIRCVPITGLPWIEIDFAEDLKRAEVAVWPKIASLEARAK